MEPGQAAHGWWQSAGRYALLRVPRPLCGLLLDLRKAYHPTDCELLKCWQVFSGAIQSDVELFSANPIMKGASI